MNVHVPIDNVISYILLWLFLFFHQRIHWLVKSWNTRYITRYYTYVSRAFTLSSPADFPSPVAPRTRVSTISHNALPLSTRTKIRSDYRATVTGLVVTGRSRGRGCVQKSCFSTLKKFLGSENKTSRTCSFHRSNHLRLHFLMDHRK